MRAATTDFFVLLAVAVAYGACGIVTLYAAPFAATSIVTHMPGTDLPNHPRKSP